MSELDKLMSNSGCITAEEIKSFAAMLGNSSYVRYWLNMYKLSDWQTVMGIQVLGFDGKTTEILGIESFGFVKDKNNLYLIKRCKEDGSPFIL